MLSGKMIPALELALINFPTRKEFGASSATFECVGGGKRVQSEFSISCRHRRELSAIAVRTKLGAAI